MKGCDGKYSAHFGFFVVIQIDTMKAGVESRLNAFMQEAEKFTARWHQLKPRDIDLDLDDDALLQSVSSLKERRAEFDELSATMEGIK